MCCASLLETVTGGRLLLVNRVSEGLGPRTEASEFVPALSPPPMPKHRFQIGDKVRVTGMSPVTFPLGAKDELGTEKLLKNMLGKVYTVQGSTSMETSNSNQSALTSFGLSRSI